MNIEINIYEADEVEELVVDEVVEVGPDHEHDICLECGNEVNKEPEL